MVCKVECEANLLKYEDYKIRDAPFCSYEAAVALLVSSIFYGCTSIFLNFVLIRSKKQKKSYKQLSPMNLFNISQAVSSVFLATLVMSMYPYVITVVVNSKVKDFASNYNISSTKDLFLCVMTAVFLSTNYHLVLLSVLRYYAISKVFKMKQLSKKKIVLFLVAVWVLSATNAILCVAFINTTFNEALMFYFYVPKFNNKTDKIIIPVLITIVLVIPNFFMIVCTKMTKTKLSVEMKKYNEIRSSDMIERIKEQQSLLKYLTWSQAGHLIVFGPFILMYVLSQVGLCDPRLGLEWIITICGYSALLTGFVNIFVSLIRSKEYRNDLKLTICKLFCIKKVHKHFLI